MEDATVVLDDETALTETAQAIASIERTAPVPPAGAVRAGGNDEPDPNRWRSLPLILAATFMALFDVFAPTCTSATAAWS